MIRFDSTCHGQFPDCNLILRKFSLETIRRAFSRAVRVRKSCQRGKSCLAYQSTYFGELERAVEASQPRLSLIFLKVKILHHLRCAFFHWRRRTKLIFEYTSFLQSAAMESSNSLTKVLSRKPALRPSNFGCYQPSNY